MINLSMKSAALRRRWPLYTAIIGGLLLIVVAGLFALAPSAHAAIVTGNPGAPGSGGGGSGYHTTNGHGWKEYTVGGAGPAAFQDGSSWASVSARCASVGADKVWVYVIRNRAGSEKSYTFTNTYNYYKANFNPDTNAGGARAYPSKPWWIDRPGSGGDPYVYNTSGVYDGIARYGGSSGYGAADNVVNSVRAKYEKEGGDSNIWGWSIGWFCYNSNPPWTVGVTASVPAIAEPGEEVTWTHRVTNNGDGKTNKDIIWKYTSDFPSGVATDWNFTLGKTKGQFDTKTSTYLVKPADFGKTLCRTTIAAPKSNVDAGQIASTPACVVIGKRPKVQVLGGDLIVGRGSATNPSAVSNVTTSVSRMASGLYYGSWAEYGITATGTVAGMASGSGYVGGSLTNNLCSLSILTFTNYSTLARGGTCNVANIGQYIHSTPVPNVADRFKTTPSTPSIAGTSVSLMGSNLSGLYSVPTTTSALTITSNGAIPAGRWIVINAPNTTVTIGEDITYTGASLSGTASIPQVIIIAKNIIISDTVGNVDSWLITTGSGADGRLNTCGAGGVGEATALTRTLCVNKLTVNGPVMANHLILRRTAGAGTDTQSGDPAEVFNLRADAYIWATNYNLSAGRLPTASTKELPPRF